MPSLVVRPVATGARYGEVAGSCGSCASGNCALKHRADRAKFHDVMPCRSHERVGAPRDGDAREAGRVRTTGGSSSGR